MKHLEQKYCSCSKCNKSTVHFRNNSSTSGLMIFIHILLTIFSMGLWLIVWILWAIGNYKIGGWKCSECGK